jgi:plasmid stabilization system protein ParE
MACKYVLLDGAKGEIDEAAAYLLAETGSKKAASDFFEMIQRAIDMTCEFPTMHAVSRMPELAELGYRVMLAGSYVILYTFEEDVIFIAHVFHQRQDYAHLV